MNEEEQKKIRTRRAQKKGKRENMSKESIRIKRRGENVVMTKMEKDMKERR